MKELQQVFLELAEFAVASRVVNRGGLAVALARMVGEVGLEINFEEKNRKPLENYFAERFYSGVWALRSSDLKRLEEVRKKFPSARFVKLGISKLNVFKLNNHINLTPLAVKTAYGRGLGRIVDSET